MKDPTKAAPGSANDDIKASSSIPPLDREKNGDYPLFLSYLCFCVDNLNHDVCFSERMKSEFSRLMDNPSIPKYGRGTQSLISMERGSTQGSI